MCLKWHIPCQYAVPKGKVLCKYGFSSRAWIWSVSQRPTGERPGHQSVAQGGGGGSRPARSRDLLGRSEVIRSVTSKRVWDVSLLLSYL